MPASLWPQKSSDGGLLIEISVGVEVWGLLGYHGMVGMGVDPQSANRKAIASQGAQD